MKLREIIIPQDKLFFELLFKQSQVLLKGVEAFSDLVNNYHDVRAKAADINEIEHEGDRIAHELYIRLNRSFITPLDREDLISLAAICDDVLDAINGAARRLVTFDIEAPTEKMKNFIEIILKATRKIDAMMSNIKKADQKQVDKLCEEVDMLENQGDELLHASLAELFRKENASAAEIIKYKEIYEWLESTLDRCEDMAYAVADIIMKSK